MLPGICHGFQESGMRHSPVDIDMFSKLNCDLHFWVKPHGSLTLTLDQGLHPLGQSQLPSYGLFGIGLCKWLARVCANQLAQAAAVSPPLTQGELYACPPAHHSCASLPLMQHSSPLPPARPLSCKNWGPLPWVTFLFEIGFPHEIWLGFLGR